MAESQPAGQDICAQRSLPISVHIQHVQDFLSAVCAATLAGHGAVCPCQAKELGHNITTHGDIMSAEERTAKSQVRILAHRVRLKIGLTLGQPCQVATAAFISVQAWQHLRHNQLQLQGHMV